MILQEFSTGFSIDCNLKIYGIVYSNLKDERVSIVLDEENKVKDMSCSCKYGTIMTSMNRNMRKPCKHIKFLIDSLNKIGWEINE